MRRASAILIALAFALGPGVAQASDGPASDAGTFVATGAPSEFRFMHAAAPLPDGRVLVTGGWYNFTELAEAWDPATGTFEPAGSLIAIRARHTMTTLEDGRVLVVGGPGGPESEGFTAAAELWDPASETFTPAGVLATGRAMHTATLLDDGRVLVIGGTDGNGAVAAAEAWDPATGTFQPAGSLGQARASHTATLLSDGRVLVTGGWDWATEPALASSEIWDPATETFAPTSSLLQPRESHTATLLDDGQVLIVAGRSRSSADQAGATAERWDPVSESFRPAGTLAEARLMHSANLLPDGRVLVVGGLDPATEETMIATAEIWDPSTTTFGPAGTLTGGTFGHTATLLPDGRVLIVGSLYEDEDFVSMAEIWEPVEE